MTSTAPHPQFPAGHSDRAVGLRWIQAVPALAFVLALAASITLLFLPVYSSTDADGVGSATLLEMNGAGALVPLAIPVVLTAVIALVRGRAAGVIALLCAMLLFAFTVLALFTVGTFFLPAALVAIIAAVIRLRDSRRWAMRR